MIPLSCFILGSWLSALGDIASLCVHFLVQKIQGSKWRPFVSATEFRGVNSLRLHVGPPHPSRQCREHFRHSLRRRASHGSWQAIRRHSSAICCDSLAASLVAVPSGIRWRNEERAL